MADDAYSFALQWLKDAITFCPSQVESLTSILTACQEAVSNLDLDHSIPSSMHPPPDRWDPSMLPHVAPQPCNSEPSQAGLSKPWSTTSSKGAASSAASTSCITSMAPSTLTTHLKPKERPLSGPPLPHWDHQLHWPPHRSHLHLT
jgi:hypothetical protein